MRRLGIGVAGQVSFVIGLDDHIVGENPRFSKAALHHSNRAIRPHTRGPAPARGKDTNAAVARTDQVIAKDEVFDLHLGTIGGYENASTGRKPGVMLDDHIVGPIFFLVGSDGPKPPIRAAIAGGVDFRVDVLEDIVVNIHVSNFAG